MRIETRLDESAKVVLESSRQERELARSYHNYACSEHSPKSQLLSEWRLVICTISFNLGMLHEQVDSGNPEVLEDCIAIIIPIVCKFGPVQVSRC